MMRDLEAQVVVNFIFTIRRGSVTLEAQDGNEGAGSQT